jgi:tetratricopeptide (TPR) repeat protein
MSQRHPKGDPTSASNAPAAGPRQEVERLIERHRFKDAFKQAKLGFHKQGTPENRQLVERTYLLRLQELVRGGMSSAAAEVARSFLEFGVTDQHLLQDLVVLLPRVGMGEQAIVLSGRIQLPEAQSSLSLKLADESVIHPEQAPASMPELRSGAARIRSALSALYEGSEERATELLKDIPRSSPFADWRYFVRGLAAYYRRDPEATAANWDRLQPERAAARIAAVVRRVDDASSAPEGRNSGDLDLSRLERAVLGEVVLGRLARLRQWIDRSDAEHHNWKKAIESLRGLRVSLRRLDVRLAQRLTQLLLQPLIEEATTLSYEAGRRLVHDFIAAAEPLPLDPKWNRLWALLWETAGTIEQASKYWELYTHDLEQVTSLSADDRRRLQALVWRHIAQGYAREVEGDLPTAFSFMPVRDNGHLRQRAVEALQRSLQIDPQQRVTYDLLIQWHQDWNQPQEAADAARRCLVAFPDDLEALNLLIDYHSRRDEPVPVLHYVERARALKPLDSSYIHRECFARVALARHLALAKKYDEARAEFARIDALDPEYLAGFRGLAKRAALELKAGNEQQGVALVRQAQSLLSDPAPLWLVLSIDATRYKLAKHYTRMYREAWQAALQKKKSGTTAGLLADTILSYLVCGVEYHGRERHLVETLEYIRRTTRIRYADSDLVSVCLLLKEVGDEPLLLEKFIRRGLKQAPRSPVFPILASELAVRRGPSPSNLRRARKDLQRGIELAQQSESPSERALVEDAKRRLLLLDDMGDLMARAPALSGGFPFSFEDLILDFDGEDEEYDGESYFADQPEPFGPSARNRRRAPARRRK